MINDQHLTASGDRERRNRKWQVLPPKPRERRNRKWQVLPPKLELAPTTLAAAKAAHRGYVLDEPAGG